MGKGLGWAAGAVGTVFNKASEGIGNLGSIVGDGGEGSEYIQQVPRCRQGHRLRTEARSDKMCDLCGARGTRYACSTGCSFDICIKCFEKAPAGAATQPSRTGSTSGTPQRTKSAGAASFDD